MYARGFRKLFIVYACAVQLLNRHDISIMVE